MADVRAAIAALTGALVAAFATTQAASATADIAAPRIRDHRRGAAGGGRLALIWPVPTAARLALHGDLASVLADRPVAIDPPVVATLSPWLLDLSAGRRPEALLLRLRAGVRAALTQPRPRLTLIELVRAPPAPDPGPRCPRPT